MRGNALREQKRGDNLFQPPDCPCLSSTYCQKIIVTALTQGESVWLFLSTAVNKLAPKYHWYIVSNFSMYDIVKTNRKRDKIGGPNGHTNIALININLLLF